MTGLAGALNRVALVAVAIVFGLLISEYSVRFAVPKYDPAGHIAFFADPVTGVLLGKPNSRTRQIKNSGDYDVEVAFNRHGLRDPRDIATGKLDDLYVLGDSFAFGWGVERAERFSDVLETLTGRRVLNIATTANVDGYERLLSYSRAQGAKIRNVILAVNMIDDVQVYEPVAKPAAGQSNMAPPVGHWTFGLQDVKAYLIRNSALYFLTTSAIGSIDILRRVLVRVGVVKTLNFVSGGRPGEGAVNSTANRLLALSKSYNLTLLIIPSRGLWVGSNRTVTLAAHQKFIAALDRLGLNYVDMRIPMEATGNPMAFHFQYDGHWRPKGHALAASLLASRLKQTEPN